MSSDLTKLPEAFNKVPGGEKIARVLIGLIGLGIIVVIGNWAFPHLIKFFTLGTKAIGRALMFGATAMLSIALVGIVAKLWPTLKMWHHGLARKLGGAIVKSDPLQFMKTGIEIFEAKYAKLIANKKIVRGKETYIAGEIVKAEKLKQEQLDLAGAAREMGKQPLMQHHAGLANTYDKSIQMLRPVSERIHSNRCFLDKLEENWALNIDKLKTEVQIMETTFAALKATDAASTLAEEYMTGASTEGKIFLDAKRYLEQNMADMLANIDNFEQKMQPVIESMEMQKQVNAQQGIRLLEEMSGDKILMDVDSWKLNAPAAQITKKNNEFGDLI